eukprot:gnl/MRDRNA2_/MRDRNA2_75248_c0_seq1.p1 gnl/MRDRNA2_/MRDRNA2_75248_c0~~gnl/MRDRNA2_/MRDRNA2_75248_c0_seq1.p1  ORF type:complete len:136 (+),score=20.90 gnl/MRDRNA2_/MRDRNA2_75248_c0_seq1:414-821(+)
MFSNRQHRVRLKCLESGKYNHRPPMCMNTCQVPPQPLHSTVSFENLFTTEDKSPTVILKGESISYFCNAGCRIVGNTRQTCLADGVFDKEAPRCDCDDNGANPARDEMQSAKSTGPMGRFVGMSVDRQMVDQSIH